MRVHLLIKKAKASWPVRIILISCIVGLSSLAGIAIYDYDYIGRSKIALTEMTIAVKSIQEAVVKCNSESNGVVQPCKDAGDKANLLSTKDRVYIMAGNNSIVGIDYRRHVFLLMGYRHLDGKVVWDCFSSPVNISTSSCHKINEQ